MRAPPSLRDFDFFVCFSVRVCVCSFRSCDFYYSNSRREDRFHRLHAHADMTHDVTHGPLRRASSLVLVIVALVAGRWERGRHGKLNGAVGDESRGSQREPGNHMPVAWMHEQAKKTHEAAA